MSFMLGPSPELICMAIFLLFHQESLSRADHMVRAAVKVQAARAQAAAASKLFYQTLGLVVFPCFQVPGGSGELADLLGQLADTENEIAGQDERLAE